MRFLYFPAFFAILYNVYCLDATFPDYIHSGADIVGGIVGDIPNVIPSPEDLFDLGKNAIAGYPFVVAISILNELCSAVVSQEAINPRITPNISNMNFQLRTACNNFSYPLENPADIFDNPDFDISKPVVIVADGWTSNINDSETIATIGKAYICRGDVNFIGVDVAHYIDTLYTWSALNTDEIGKYIAMGLMKLTQKVPLENIHLIGHSLGSHIVGSTARYYNEFTGDLLPRVTALDPAKPCFFEGEELPGLQRGDAVFIDIIHSNPGIFGIAYPLGDADFFVNGMNPLPPGCVTISCAHARSWMYYAESVYKGNEHNFMARRCSSLRRLRENRCRSEEVPMGYAAPSDLKGNYFLEVNAESPYGQGGDPEREMENENCGLCNE